MLKYYILNFLVFLTVEGYSQIDNTHQNLWTLTKVYGVVKYYNNEKDDKYLDDELLKVLPNLKKTAYDNEKFNIDIKNLLRGDEKVIKSALQPERPFDQFTDKDYITTIDFSWIEKSLQLSEENKILLKQLINSHKNIANKNIGHKQIYIHNEQIGLESISKNEEYILALIKYWNVMDYFFAYKNLMDTDWDTALSNEVSGFYEIQSYYGYNTMLRRLCAYLQDGHIDIEDRYRDDFNVWKLPFYVTVAEDQLVVNSINDSLSNLYGIKTGDVIEELDGKGYGELWQEFSELVSYSTTSGGQEYFRTYLWQRFNYNDSSVSVVFNSDNGTHKEYIKPIKLADFRKIRPWVEKIGKFKSIDGNIGYIDFDNMSYSNLGKAIRQLKKKKYIILDCRGYPGGVFAQLRLNGFLFSKRAPVAKNYGPNVEYPGVFDDTKLLSYNFLQWMRRSYKGQLIVLIDGSAISAMETLLMSVEAKRPKAVFIGTPTQGVDGEQNLLLLPDGIKILYTGNNFSYHDGSQFQRIGIQPDIRIEPTIESIKKGEDNVLIRAIEYINNLDSN